MIENKKYTIDYRKGRLDCSNAEQRIGDTLCRAVWRMALDFGLTGLYESDIQWIENNITKNSQNNISLGFPVPENEKRGRIHR